MKKIITRLMILFGILSLKKDGRLFHFKRRFEDIKKFIIEIVNRVGFKGK